MAGKVAPASKGIRYARVVHSEGVVVSDGVGGAVHPASTATKIDCSLEGPSTMAGSKLRAHRSRR
ncbi:MAG: hypothetical protein AAFU79_22700, partial [Myxococcota bacterium]